jgi:hypothetical protein
MELVAMVARTLWLRRNAVIFRRPLSHHSTVIRFVTNSLAAFRDAIARPLPAAPVDHLSIPHWLAPLVGWVKANWDAAVDKASQEDGHWCYSPRLQWGGVGNLISPKRIHHSS